LAALQFAQFQAELPGKTGQAGAAMENLQIAAAPGQQGAQDHDAPLLREQGRPGPAQLFENKAGQALEGKNVQAGVAGQGGVAEELPFQLESGLFGGEENEGRPLGVLAERGANFRQAPESFPAAGRTEEKARLHTSLVAQKRGRGKEKGGPAISGRENDPGYLYTRPATPFLSSRSALAAICPCPACWRFFFRPP
jgi:hypothetical protein